MVKHTIVKSVLAFSLLIALLWLAVEGIARNRAPSVIKIVYIDNVGNMELNGLRMTHAEIAAFCEKTNLSKLRRIELIGFEHGTARQIRRTYDLFSERGYSDKLTLVFSHLEMPVWIYPMEDHHQEVSFGQAQVLDVLVEDGGLRIGGVIREFVKYPTNGIPRLFCGGIRNRIFDSVVYKNPDDVLGIAGIRDIPKDLPIEILCEESVACLPVLQTLKVISNLGFDKLYLTFY